MITQAQVKDLFEYKDGNLYWIKKTHPSVRIDIGDKAGTILNKKQGRGYIVIKVNKNSYLAHRLIYLYHHGYMPEFIDHIDGDQGNNKVENLRPCSAVQNQYNRKINKNNNIGS